MRPVYPNARLAATKNKAAETPLVGYARMRPSLTPAQQRIGDGSVSLIDCMRQLGEQSLFVVAAQRARFTVDDPASALRPDARPAALETSALVTLISMRAKASVSEQAAIDYVLRWAEWSMTATSRATVTLVDSLVLLKRADEAKHARV